MAIPLEVVWLSPYIHAVVVFILGLVFISVIRHYLNRLIIVRFNQPSLLPLSRFIYWLILIVILMMSLKQLGFELSLALQAVGFLTVALGFGLQGIASNFVCGLFLLTDKSFTLGEKVRLNDKIGKIDVIQLLTTQLLDDNDQVIRIPNNLFFTSTLINLSRASKSTGSFTLTVNNCALTLQELSLLINHTRPETLHLVECELKHIDNQGKSKVIDCSYCCDSQNELANNNSMLEYVAKQLTDASINFQLHKA
jgi:small-conductance mechanosensitive channel